MWQLCLWLKTWKWCGSSFLSAWLPWLSLKPERGVNGEVEDAERGVYVVLGWEVSRVDAKELAEEGGGAEPEMFFARFKIESSAAFGAVEEMPRTAVKRVVGANGRAELSPKRRRVAIRLIMCGLVSSDGAEGLKILFSVVLCPAAGEKSCQAGKRRIGRAGVSPVGKIKSSGRESTPAESQNRRQRLSRQHHDEAFNRIFIQSAFCALLRGGL